jgi:hypothetical protein
MEHWRHQSGRRGIGSRARGTAPSTRSSFDRALSSGEVAALCRGTAQAPCGDNVGIRARSDDGNLVDGDGCDS